MQYINPPELTRNCLNLKKELQTIFSLINIYKINYNDPK